MGNKVTVVVTGTAIGLLAVGMAGWGRGQPPGSPSPSSTSQGGDGREVAQPAKGDAADKAAIAKNGDAFIAAFDKGDARAVAAFWTPDGDYTDQTGHTLKGREAIEKAFKDFFAENKGVRARIDSHALRFVTADVAIEDGITEVLTSEGLPPSRARYTIVHVKKDGRWYLDSVRDAPYTPPGNYENLRALEWAVGNWSAESDKGDAEHLSLSWASNQNFLVATFTATVKGVSVGSATHWIGWDPKAKRVRSWIFDATGGFGEGAWTESGGQWSIKSTSTLQDGTGATETIVLGRVDADTITLQSKDRTVDGKSVADTQTFKLKRVK
jgi:uncharacterized protein (TIGR02246 family)